MRKPPRTSAWSSAITTRRVIAAAPAAGGRGPGSRRAAVGPASSVPPSSAARSRMPDQPVAGRLRRCAAAPPGRRRRPRPRARRGRSGRVTSARGGAGVAQRVGERLLDDAVGGEVEPGGQVGPGSPSRRDHPRARRRAAARPARRCGRGPGWGGRRRPPLRRRPGVGTGRRSRRRSSRQGVAARPARSSAGRRGPGRGARRRRRRRRPACTTITDTLWAITSCSSRAMRACSSPRPAGPPPDGDAPVARGLAQRPHADGQHHVNTVSSTVVVTKLMADSANRPASPTSDRRRRAVAGQRPHGHEPGDGDHDLRHQQVDRDADGEDDGGDQLRALVAPHEGGAEHAR